MEYCNYQYTEALDKNWLSDKAISFLDSMLVENEDEMLHKAKIALCSFRKELNMQLSL